ncbi:hypothetical protein FQR65_LT08451 [Abscondita terminalis]|nr:hypothetical protein FQR65_LT08451 [Abscondita terminalis]
MFSKKESILKKTGPNGVGRLKFLSLITQEFKKTNSYESKRQVLANLSNFSYDPINYQFIRELQIIDLFLQQLSQNIEEFIHFSLAGLCNLSPDPKNAEYIVRQNGVFLISQYLLHQNIEISLNALSTLIFLINTETQAIITTPNIISKIFALPNKLIMHPVQPVWKRLISPYLCDHVKKFSKQVLQVGDTVVVRKKITEEDVNNFSKLSGDNNPIHFKSKEEYGVVHGALLNGLVSGVIGTKLPGPGTLVLSQTLHFPNKCFCNENIAITVKLIEFRKIIKVEFECKNEDTNKVVLYGDAKLKLSRVN